MSGDTTAVEQRVTRSGPGLYHTLKAHVVLIVAATVVGALIGYVISLLLPTVYTASTSVLFSVDQPFDATGERSGDPARFTADQVEIVTTDAVLTNASVRVIPAIPVEEIRSSVRAEGSQTTNRMTVTVQRRDPEQARALVDAIVAGYREEAARRVSRILSESQDVIADDFLEGQMRVRAAVYGDGVAAVEPAQLPTSPSSPRPLQNALIGALIGLLVAVAVAILRGRHRARRATVADLEMLIGAPLITRFAFPTGSAAANAALLDRSNTQTHAAQEVLAAIDVALEDRGERSVLFLSWQRAVATTSLVVSVGLATARLMRKVVLIDGGLKEHGISAITKVGAAAGLNALAERNIPLNSALRTWKHDDVEIGIVPLDGRAGSAARPQVLRAATQRLQQVASLNLVDGPPLADRSLGLALGRGVAGVVLVVDEHTSIDEAHEMGRRIELAGLHVIGYVLVTAPQRHFSGRLRLPAAMTRKQVEGTPAPGAAAGHL